MRLSKIIIGISFLLLTTSLVLPEDDFIQTLIKKMREYKAKSPHVKVYLAFNQNRYTPGDTAFFAAHFLADDLHPIVGRQILRVELVDQEGNVVFFEHITVKDGLGANQVVIPEGLSAGRYQWVSYSEYMKNFDPHFYFRQDFNLITGAELKTATNNNFAGDFFPEGGVLVESVANIIVIKTSEQSMASFKIYEGGNLVAQDSMSHGLGVFELAPQPDKIYIAELKNKNGQTKQINLPKAQATGYSLATSVSDPVQVVVRASKETRNQKENLWLVVSAQSEIFYSAPFKFGDTEQVTVQLPVKNLPRGLAQITLFNDKGIVRAERLFFNHLPAPVSVKINKDKSSYINRSLISLNVEVKDDLGNPVKGNFSIAVLNEKFSQNEVDNSMIDYLLINSELFTQEKLADFTQKELDHFLITQQNKKSDWPAIIQGSKSLKYPFRQMVYYSGEAINAQTVKPVPDSTRIITYLQKNMIGYEAFTDKNGRFDLAFLFDFWNEDEVFYMMENRRGNEIDGRIKWDQDTVRLAANTIASGTQEKSFYAQYQLQKRLIDKSYNFYSAVPEKSDAKLLADPNADFEDELTKVDISVKVQDYVVFPTMEELIREIVPSLQHRKSGGKATVRVVLSDGNIPPYDPLILIDGIMTKNTNYFLQLKTSDIITIKLVKDVNRLNRLGSIGKNGIVLVHTKKRRHPELEKINTQLPVKGLNKPVAFYESTDADRTQPRKPDFRSMLYWNPTVQTGESSQTKIMFYAADDVGNFLIRIQGITRDGRPFEKTDSFSVSFTGN